MFFFFSELLFLNLQHIQGKEEYCVLNIRIQGEIVWDKDLIEQTTNPKNPQITVGQKSI